MSDLHRTTPERLGLAARTPTRETRAELDELIARAEDGDAEAAADLEDRFAGRLAFGTAGLRGRLGAGSNRMNRVLVAQAAAGLAAYLLERPGGMPTRRGPPRVVIGYDGRRNSRVFAQDSAELFAGAGVRADPAAAAAADARARLRGAPPRRRRRA